MRCFGMPGRGAISRAAFRVGVGSAFIGLPLRAPKGAVLARILARALFKDARFAILRNPYAFGQSEPPDFCA